MPRLLLNRETLPKFEAGLHAIDASTKPKWGRMNAATMMAHLTQSLRISLGEVPVEDRSNWFTRNVVRVIAFELMSPPRNIKAPAIFDPPTVADFEREKALQLETLHRFVDTAEREPLRTGTSPMFGPMVMKHWQRIHAVHMRHHLKQFGVWT